MTTLSTNNIERIGVSAISLAFEKMGWTFRERVHTDIGIDADVEQKTDRLTSKHIALQIKSGESYLKIKKNGKISFSIDAWHYQYWLQSDRPVVIMFYDCDNDKIYWEHVRLANIEKLLKNHRIEISPNNTLETSSIQVFNDIIENYVPHNTYEVDPDCVSFDYSIACIQEYNESINDIASKLESFRSKINNIVKLPKRPNEEILKLHIRQFKKVISSHMENDYELLTKALWYLATLPKNLPDLFSNEYNNVLDKYIGILSSNKSIWLENIERFSMLYNKNIPPKVQSEAKSVIRQIENYVSLIDLSINDFSSCKIK